MDSLIFSTAFSLFILMDPIGNIPIYLSILKKLNLKRRLWIVAREMLIALAIIILFSLFGRGFLDFLEISNECIYLAGGIILFIMGLKMIFPENGSLASSFSVDGEPLIFPLAIPLVAGPAVLAAVMIYSSQLDSFFPLLTAILFAWVPSVGILLSATYLQKWLGEKGILAIERLMGLILILIAINMFLQGISLFQIGRKILS
jgi:multiple antibiotic resistance protein